MGESEEERKKKTRSTSKQKSEYAAFGFCKNNLHETQYHHTVYCPSDGNHKKNCKKAPSTRFVHETHEENRYACMTYANDFSLTIFPSFLLFLFVFLHHSRTSLLVFYILLSFIFFFCVFFSFFRPCSILILKLSLFESLFTPSSINHRFYCLSENAIFSYLFLHSNNSLSHSFLTRLRIELIVARFSERRKILILIATAILIAACSIICISIYANGKHQCA